MKIIYEPREVVIILARYTIHSVLSAVSLDATAHLSPLFIFVFFKPDEYNG